MKSEEKIIEEIKEVIHQRDLLQAEVEHLKNRIEQLRDMVRKYYVTKDTLQ